ncbi:Mobile element protein [Candidatus Rhodobacter oscarellae]|uniref:Mobile element protein n=1 Tax=Candidatus Rhodobacter oscarellae TaxID=1675527 RepID=A0A0J9EEL1_9RHOB|nr:Mobile element protein [Candidatus Rhodobacter lobularis]
MAICKLYTGRTAITAADLLNDRGIPFFADHKISLLRALTDRGTEYCGKAENHAYRLYLAVEDVDHSRAKASSPQMNGTCERFHRTIKDEFYDIAFRKKLYGAVEELQTDLDAWLASDNEQRPLSGRHCYGKTPMKTFRETLHISAENTIKTHDQSDSAQPDLSVAS